MADITVLLSKPENRCVTFYRPADDAYYVGYRLWEGAPLEVDRANFDHGEQPVSTAPPAQVSVDPLQQVENLIGGKKRWLPFYEEDEAVDEGHLSFQAYSDGSAVAELHEVDGHLNLTFFFAQERDGLRLRLEARTSRAIPAGFLIQQCLRFTGEMNQAWRTEVAHVPYLSELDMHAMGRPNATLTYGRQNGEWWPFPVQHVRIPTRAARDASAAMAIDHGLVVRESPHREEAPQWYWDRVAPGETWTQITAGLYWERTACVSNRHPADCVHAWVDIGPLPAGGTRILNGRFYYLEGSKNDLYASWEQDFTVK